MTHASLEIALLTFHRGAFEMRLGIFAAANKPDENALISALRVSPGVKLTVLSKKTRKSFERLDEHDLYCIIGVKHAGIMRLFEDKKIPYLFWDKGYNRDWPYWWRVSYCSHQPTRFLMQREFPNIRAKRQKWLMFKPWREGQTILFAGASAKYHYYHGLPNPNEYAANVLRDVRVVSERSFVYRPKPSYNAAEPVEGAVYSKGRDLAADLNWANVVITHGSSAAFDAMLAGVPCVVLGDAVMRPISSTDVADVVQPRLADDTERCQVLSALAHFQWNLDEIKNGDIWPIVKWMQQCI